MSRRVKVLQLGRSVVDCDVAEGATLGDLLQSQGIPLEAMEVRVNSEAAALERVVVDGDLVTVVPLIKGGAALPPWRSCTLPRWPGVTVRPGCG